jgi:methylamine---glutamate N-methyltransferase subunit B
LIEKDTKFMVDEPEDLLLKASDYSAIELHAQLSSLATDTAVHLVVEKRIAGICAGLDHQVSVAIDGDVGDFAFMLSDKTNYDVSGSAGICCGHSFASGNILIRGSAGNCLAAYATGGFIAVHAKAGKRCAMGLAGAEVFVRRATGDEAGYCMQEGALVLGNGAGENVGFGMTGGIIYIRGEVKSVAPHARQVRMKEAEALRLSLFLARAGIKSGNADFKVFRAK